MAFTQCLGTTWRICVLLLPHLCEVCPLFVCQSRALQRLSLSVSVCTIIVSLIVVIVYLSALSLSVFSLGVFSLSVFHFVFLNHHCLSYLLLSISRCLSALWLYCVSMSHSLSVLLLAAYHFVKICFFACLIIVYLFCLDYFFAFLDITSLFSKLLYFIISILTVCLSVFLLPYDAFVSPLSSSGRVKKFNKFKHSWAWVLGRPVWVEGF